MGLLFRVAAMKGIWLESLFEDILPFWESGQHEILNGGVPVPVLTPKLHLVAEEEGLYSQLVSGR
jgi:hypothetical protein